MTKKKKNKTCFFILRSSAYFFLTVNWSLIKIIQGFSGITPLTVVINDTRLLGKSFWHSSFSFINRERKLGHHGLVKLAISLLKEINQV